MKDRTSERVRQLVSLHDVIFICPEQASGYPTPRGQREIDGADGLDVLEGKCQVLSKGGDAGTEKFLRGAEDAAMIAELYGIEIFIGRPSPSCGCGITYDGSFKGTKIKADGVTAAALKRMGVRLIDHGELEKDEVWNELTGGSAV
jgi:uncharacterized protein YbbK (DUF523 family)